MKMLFVGALWEGSTALQRLHAFQQLGHETFSVDYATDEYQRKMHRLDYRIFNKLYRVGLHNFRCPDVANVNKRIKEVVDSSSFDIVFLDKCLAVDVSTFDYIKFKQPKCHIIGYSPDDMLAKHNQSKQFLDSLQLYDIYFTTKSYGVAELMALGCRQVYFIGNAYDPDTHKPIDLSAEERQEIGGRVGFIGAWEAERAKSIGYLTENGIHVRVWGEGWECYKSKNTYLQIEGRPLWGADYAKGICSFDINLCFLRKINRDLQTTRSVEIPACGAFMLAERTAEHLELFEEGKEADFFDSDEELLNKVRYYLMHNDKRVCIAMAGRMRCIKSRYSYVDKMNEIINKVKMLNNEPK